MHQGKATNFHVKHLLYNLACARLFVLHVLWLDFYLIGFVTLQGAIIEAGAVQLLLSFLRKNPGEKSNSSHLLCELSKIPAGKMAIISEKGSMLVIATVFNSSPENRRPQLRILLDNLCKDDTQMIVEAARSTIFEPLVASLTSGIYISYFLTGCP